MLFYQIFTYRKAFVLRDAYAIQRMALVGGNYEYVGMIRILERWSSEDNNLRCRFCLQDAGRDSARETKVHDLLVYGFIFRILI